MSQIGAVTEQQRNEIIKKSRIYGKYDTPIDRESAFEMLLKQAEQAEAEAQKAKEEAEAAKQKAKEEKEAAKAQKTSSRNQQSQLGKTLDKMATTATRTVARELVKSITGTGKKNSGSFIRSILGNLFKK